MARSPFPPCKSRAHWARLDVPWTTEGQAQCPAADPLSSRISLRTCCGSATVISVRPGGAWVQAGLSSSSPVSLGRIR